MVKAEKPTNYYLFVIHEWWGLNDYIKQESEKLGKELGINVIALDLYDNKIATSPDEAGKMVQSVKTERAVNIIKGAYVYAGGNAKVFTIGWCFGGGWSLQTALLGGNQVMGCVMYYGMPEKDVNRLKTLNCDVIGFFANKDGFITPALVEEFKANMKAADKKLTVYQYDAEHGFANPSNPHFNKEATSDAYGKTIAFIKERMK
jgi:carboxymethylenebutenolidase